MAFVTFFDGLPTKLSPNLKKHDNKNPTKVQASQINKSALVTYVSQSVMHQTLIASFRVFCRSSVIWEPKGTRLIYVY